MGRHGFAEHVRQVLCELQVANVRTQLSFIRATDWDESKTFAPAERHLKTAEAMFTQLESWAGALKGLRVPTTLNRR